MDDTGMWIQNEIDNNDGSKDFLKINPECNTAGEKPTAGSRADGKEEAENGAGLVIINQSNHINRISNSASERVEKSMRFFHGKGAWNGRESSFKRKLVNTTYTVKVHFSKNADKTFKDSTLTKSIKRIPLCETLCHALFLPGIIYYKKSV